MKYIIYLLAALLLFGCAARQQYYSDKNLYDALKQEGAIERQLQKPTCGECK
jgi:hypothetical protein